jgi:hypothetical protein
MWSTWCAGVGLGHSLHRGSLERIWSLSCFHILLLYMCLWGLGLFPKPVPLLIGCHPFKPSHCSCIAGLVCCGGYVSTPITNKVGYVFGELEESVTGSHYLIVGIDQPTGWGAHQNIQPNRSSLWMNAIALSIRYMVVPLLKGYLIRQNHES